MRELRYGKRARRAITGGLTAFGALALTTGTAALVAPSAQAYGDLTVRYAVVNTGNCERVEGNLSVDAQSNGCYLSDSADGTFFKKDSGGRAVKIQLHDSRGMVGKVEFHPYGEKLWVYDTRNDGDTIYAKVDNERPIRAPGTSNPIDYTVKDYSFGENKAVEIRVYDDLVRGLPRDLLAREVGRA